MPGLCCNVLQVSYTINIDLHALLHKYIFHTHTLNLYFFLVNSFTFFIQQYQCPHLPNTSKYDGKLLKDVDWVREISFAYLKDLKILQILGRYFKIKQIRIIILIITTKVCGLQHEEHVKSRVNSNF